MSMRMTIGVFMLILASTAFATSDKSHKTKDSYVFRDGGITWMIGTGMSGVELEALQARYGQQFFWARRNGQIFVTHEPVVLDEARLIVGRSTRGRDDREERLAEVTDAAMNRSRPHLSYVLAVDSDTTVISGGPLDINNVVYVRNKYQGRFLWARTQDGTWLIDDPDYIDRAHALFADQRALEPEQRAVSQEERELDREEERIEDRHDAESRSRLKDIHARQKEVSRREEELDKREEALEKIAESRLSALVDDAVRRGVARRVR